MLDTFQTPIIFSVPSSDITAMLKSKYCSLQDTSLVSSKQSLKNTGSDTCNKKQNFFSARSEVLRMVVMILAFWYVTMY